jgi:hypothetical protein
VEKEKQIKENHSKKLKKLKKQEKVEDKEEYTNENYTEINENNLL